MNRFTTALLLAFVLSWLTPLAPHAAEEDAARIAAAVHAAQRRNDADPTDPVNYLGNLVIEAAKDPATRKAMEQTLIGGLAGAKTRAGKDFFCRQLVFVGSEAAVPQLAKLLTDPEAAFISRYTLARLPGQAADAALLEALGTADDKLKIGLVSSLGVRGCVQAVDKITALAGGSNEELARASLTALGRIDSDAAVAAIAKAHGSVPAKLKPAATDAYLTCAARMVKQGKNDAAMAIYRQLFAADEPAQARVGALIGMVTAQKDQAAAVALSALHDKDPQVRRVAVPTLRSVPGEAVTKAVVAALGTAGEDVQVMLLSLLGDRGDPTAMAAIVKATAAPTLAVRIAALSACATIGDSSVVPLLAQRAAEAKETTEAQAARSSLYLLRGPAINAAVAKLLTADNKTVRTEAVKALATRNAVDQMEALVRAAEDKEAAVGAEAMKSLRTLGTAKDLPLLLKLQVGAKDDGVRGEAENTVVAVAKANADAGNPAAPALDALGQAKEPVARASVIRVLGRIGHVSALPVLYAGVKEAAPEVKDAAIRALAEWPTGEPAPVLHGLAGDPAASQVHRVLALRGYINMLAKQPEASDEQILQNYEKAMAMAGRVEEKQLVISKLALVRDRRALDLAKRLAAEPTLKQSAEAAMAAIEKLLAAPAKVTASKSPEKAPAAIDGDPSSRWDTGGAQEGGEWFRIELDGERLISAVVLDTRGSGGDYPRGYEVYVSNSTLGEGKLVAKGQGKEALLKIAFQEPVRGKAIKIVQTGKAEGLFWSIHELTVESKPVD